MKKNKSISDQVLKSIINHQIKPIPKWEFILKNYSLWILFTVSILIGSIAVSTFIYMFNNNDWDLSYFPYFWLILTLVFIGFAYLIFFQTKKAYRFSFKIIIVSELILSLIFGGIFSLFNVGKDIDSLLARDIPIYRQVAPMKMKVWMDSSNGRISGIITKIISPTSFELRDFNNQIWTVYYKDTFVRGRAEILVGSQIKIIGAPGSGIFQAEEIRPWDGKGINMMKEN